MVADSRSDVLAARRPLGGLVAGTPDVGAAALINRVSPVLILRVIAGGLLGRATIASGGTAVALPGLLLQWAMSVLIAGIFALAALRMPVLRRHFVLAGCGYGMVVFVVMEFVVVPLSALHHWPPLGVPWRVRNLPAMFVFGILVAAFARCHL